MKILYINEAPEVYARYRQGLIPSHWFYGAVEMEKDGNEVIWCKEVKSLLYDLKLVIKHKPDFVFLPNLNLQSHLLLLILSSVHLIRIPIYAYLHHAPKLDEGMKTKLYKWFLPSIKHLFFLSEKSMEETIERRFIARDKCSVPGWGPDQEFYDKVKKEEQGYFVSTGKENRDFDILIEAFRRTGAPLRILTAQSHAGSDYTDLVEKCKSIPNIQIELTENSSSVYPMMLEAMANAKALVCPLRKDKLDYCVGLSTIADAEGLYKPLIITKNPYHSPSRMKKFNVVDSIEDWVEAIEDLQRDKANNISYIHPTMEIAYYNMRQYLKP